MKTQQNVLKMYIASPDTRERATPLTDGYNNTRMVQLSAFD